VPTPQSNSYRVRAHIPWPNQTRVAETEYKLTMTPYSRAHLSHPLAPPPRHATVYLTSQPRSRIQRRWVGTAGAPSFIRCPVCPRNLAIQTKEEKILEDSKSKQEALLVSYLHGLRGHAARSALDVTFPPRSSPPPRPLARRHCAPQPPRASPTPPATTDVTTVPTRAHRRLPPLR